MEFFEQPKPPPPPPPRERHRTPPWLAAPSDILPGVVPLELVLARTPKVAVCVSRLGAYPSGFELDLITIAADDTDELDPLFFEGHRFRGGRRAGEIANEMLRFGVEFADGTKATNTAEQPLVSPGGHATTVHLTAANGSREPREPVGPVLMTGGGGGGGGHWRQSVWIWPLPPPGRLTFVCQWTAANIELTRRDVDAQLILDASARAQELFADAH